MARICNKLHNVLEDEQNIEENISWMIYIASLTENCIVSNDIEIASKIISSRASFKSYFPEFIDVLKEIGGKKVISLSNYKIAVADKWLFQIILLNSIKHFNIFQEKTESVDYYKTDVLISIVKYIIEIIDIVKENSIHLLKTLQYLMKRQDILSDSLSYDILKCMSKVALSPITGFKQIAHEISKIVIPFLSFESLELIHNSLILPVRGVETFPLLRLLPDHYIMINLQTLVKKVLKMFTNSIENKDGGFLYDRLLICDFENWRNQIWPYFCKKLLKIEYEGEFCQSLVKYWIPSSVSAYKTEFYDFLRNEPIDHRLKAYILLESRKQGYPLEDANLFFYNADTRNLGLRLAATYRKKTLCPIKSDIKIIMDFLYSNLKTFLEDDELKSISLMFSQVFFYAHNDLKRSCENIGVYEKVVNEVYEYCYGNLITDHYEVGAQLLHILWTTLTGSHKDLTLMYKVDKKDIYDKGENLLYKELKNSNKWKFENKVLVSRLEGCFVRNDYYSQRITNLILHYYSHHTFVNIDILKQVIARVENISTLQNTEKIVNCTNIIFQTGLYLENERFIEEIRHILLEHLFHNTIENKLFKSVLYLEIIASARRHNFNVQNFELLLKESLRLIEFVLESDSMENASYKSRKVFETFVARVMSCIMYDLDSIWQNIDKIDTIMTLKKIINRSNMKRPVSLSVEVLRQFGCKMEESEEDEVLKIKLLNDVLQTMYDTSLRPDLKMRRNPESRLVVHALCVSQKCPGKPLLKWVFDYLLNLISDSQSSDFSISSSLHTIELLISDNRLHQQTLQFIPSVIIQCVEIFKKPSWIVRNANLQLAKSLIERLYGVSLHFFNRPRCIEDLFVVFPNLATYFYKILSTEILDERSVIVFHFFLESQIKEQVFANSVHDILGYFQILFVHIIKNYQNHFGKLAVSSYVSLCHSKKIPEVLHDITEFVISKYTTMKKNIFRNLVFLIQELYEKYENSFEYYSEPQSMVKIHRALKNLSYFLEKFDSELNDFLLLKVRRRMEILKCFEKKTKSENRIWLNNNVPFLIMNTESSNMFVTLEKILLDGQPSFIHVKILSILVSKFENNYFAEEDITSILRVLFNKSIILDDSNFYLHNCYFKVILLFMKSTTGNEISLTNVSLDYHSLYKSLIFILYLSVDRSVPKNKIEDFYRSVQKQFINSFGINEDTDNDIISTFIYCVQNSPQQFRFELSKMVLYFSQFESTHLETYFFISTFMGRCYSGILDALKDFLSSKNLYNFMKNELCVELFYEQVIRYLDETTDEVDPQDDFYTVERDELIPPVFLKKLIFFSKCIHNKI